MEWRAELGIFEVGVERELSFYFDGAALCLLLIELVMHFFVQLDLFVLLLVMMLRPVKTTPDG